MTKRGNPEDAVRKSVVEAAPGHHIRKYIKTKTKKEALCVPSSFLQTWCVF